MTGRLDTDVIVVGAGPVGLVLTGELRLNGVRAITLERLPEPTGESRASILHARTMSLFAERGVLDWLGPVPEGGPGHFGGIRLDLAAAAPGHPFAGQWECPQARLEVVLGEWVADLGADVRRGHLVTGLRQHPDRVEVDVRTPDADGIRRLSAAYVVGCDGEDSTVRRLAGIDLAGAGATRQMLRADVVGIDIPNRRLQRLPNGVATAYRRADGTTRLMVHRYGRPPRTGQPAPDFAEVVALWAEVTGEDIGHGVPRWVNRFDDACLQATRYRIGRVLLAGDAAHVQMPIGGQALNLGIQDAIDLGSKLAARVTGAADEAVLDAYHAGRHPVGARTLTNIRAQAHLLFGADVDALRATFAELLSIDVVRDHLARMISGLDVPETTVTAGAGEPASPATQGHRTRSAAPDRSAKMEKLTGRTALVTGSSRGIGRATAQRLAREGALVAVHYATNEEAARETVELIEKDGGRAFPVRAELGVPGDVHELFLGLEQGLKERTGDTTLHILVNNAAETSPTGIPPADVTPEQFDRYVAINAKAPFFIVQRALDLIPEGGRIINISSGLTRCANPDQVVYAMTKGAIEQITLHFARYLGPRGITVNTVAPGITNNGNPVFDVPEIVVEMARLSAFRRVGEAADVADVVAFLASDDARWITGAFIDASGGTLLGQ
ncbi:SDR family oxidoreductase [Micromonospora sp. HM5-17]|uniref:SDR family oxidoreductase n=1 Tax=Micromonospora sp. HM5-17 TaxID=2487710 RepID=UPI000F48A558|nr:SDR family oxidoreductase [Micromonospora sp. HM5-17]ROT33852.1 SDR family oxidoreductase [Micromonospora sp. HM5-17]